MGHPAEELTLFHPAGYLRPPGSTPFGKDVANTALFASLAAHGGYSRINVLHQVQAGASELASQFFADPARGGTLATGNLWNTELPSRSGVLLRGAADLTELAWLRRGAGAELAYSLVGLIHTLGPPAIRHQIIGSALAPVQPWDALICTSPAVRSVVEQLLEQQEAWHAERFGASRQPRPQLPLIPLGVAAAPLAAQAQAPQPRSRLRGQLGLEPDDVLVLWVGRLSYYEKAFPQAMLQAVHLASQRTGQGLMLALAGWFPGGAAERELYLQAARQLAPGLELCLLDGGDPAVVAQAWAAADVFLSLVDNIQETFGLTPIEAMASGLPLVVSDWDGYRSTVRDGVEGFLVPTLASPPGAPGELLAHLHNLELETYQTYAGAVAQHTAVHIGAAAEALVRLAESPDLRARMGAAGQQRARQHYDWPVVVGHYNALFADLAERRGAALGEAVSPLGARLQPGRGDPFAEFQVFASTVLRPELKLKLVAGAAPGDLQVGLSVQLNRLYPGLRGTPAEALQLLEAVQAAGAAGASVGKLLAAVPPARRPYLETTLVWLAKQGLLDWL